MIFGNALKSKENWLIVISVSIQYVTYVIVAEEDKGEESFKSPEYETRRKGVAFSR